MSNPTLPGGLSFSPIVGTHSWQDQDTNSRFQPDVGDEQVRPRYTASARPMSFQIQVDGTAFDLLETFYNTTLKKGSLFFDDSSIDGTSYTYRFAGPYKVQRLSAPDRLYQVSINLVRKAQ